MEGKPRWGGWPSSPRGPRTAGRNLGGGRRMEEESSQMLQAVLVHMVLKFRSPVGNCRGCNGSGQDRGPWLWWGYGAPKCGKLGLPGGLWGNRAGWATGQMCLGL